MFWLWQSEQGVTFELKNRIIQQTVLEKLLIGRQYILWRYKKLGRGNRRVCPSCVVLAIRQLYPAQDGIYMGFKRA
jgi:P2X purinoceptor 7